MTTVGRYKLSGFLISDDFFYIESRDIISFFLQTEFSKHRIFVTLIGGAHNIKARFKIWKHNRILITCWGFWTERQTSKDSFRALFIWVFGETLQLSVLFQKFLFYLQKTAAFCLQPAKATAFKKIKTRNRIDDQDLDQIFGKRKDFKMLWENIASVSFYLNPNHLDDNLINFEVLNFCFHHCWQQQHHLKICLTSHLALLPKGIGLSLGEKKTIFSLCVQFVDVTTRTIFDFYCWILSEIMWEAKGMTIFTSENLKKWFFAAISRQPDLYLWKWHQNLNDDNLVLFLKNKWQAIINYGVKNNFFYQFQKYRYLTTSLFYTFARNIKKHIKSLATREVSQPREKIENYAKVIKKHSKLSLSQQEAVMLPLQNRFSMINGVAGSGKTFVIASIVKFVFALKMFNNCFVLAPTGKAVQVLRSKCRAALAEKHLWFDDDNVITVDAFIYRQIAHKKIKPRQQILVLIDEAGMLSTGLFSDLLTILEQADFDYHLVLVGDHQQLFPIFPGKLFFDLLAKQKLVKITLPTTFRHQQSGILRLANKVLAGKMLKLAVLQNQQDVVFINTNRMSDQQVNQRIKELSRSFLDQNNRLSFYYDFQIIAPFRYQCHMINQNLNAYLFPASDLHKKLMVNKNDYVRKVFNGNVGEVVAFTKRLVTMKFLPSPKKNTKIKVPRYYLADACAVTIHKAQGSEYDTVVVVMNKSTRMPNFLTRNLFYTALTRAKSKLYIFGSYALLCSVTKTITINKQTLLGNSYFWNH